ncbi:SARP family transcriptional regulator [Amycolatopsis sp. WAC 01416]|uniref:AfsR/SARP family transcriptional regulator n=1 Tax=Amycolatopsis sp. WAC 01416 TaxID=2203196 RepID=UPI000F79B511|nr:BTAD domain-containing putative transcriptional regulator [Amycolatopsis sp. WAC 01416]RSN24863.1 SARP family transcriptional regulator [Amycolatopsis sp. WAC 01416]
MGLTFQVLGRVEALRADRPVDLGHHRQRGVLAALLADANTAVTTDSLVDRVWGAQAPARARHALYSYLSRLRRVIAASAAITRQTGGYLLALDRDAVDMHRFRRLVGEADAATDDETALSLIEQAMRLWRGEPFAGLDTPWFSSIRDRLQAEKVTAQLRRNDLALDLGRHVELLADLRDEAAEHPLDEYLAGQLMLALYRGGKQADALEHFRRVRARLADELGADPGAELRSLHQRILSAAPSLSLPAAGRGAINVVSSPTPRQLPAPPAHFVGRADEIAVLDKALDADPGSAVITAISGTGGIGKTWLALRWAHDNLDRFPGGQLYADLRGFDPAGNPLAPADVIRSLLASLEVPPERVPADHAAQAALYRSLLANRRLLLVLDNARDTEQVLPLLPGSPSCLVLVTSRSRLSGLVARHNATPVSLETLSEVEATALLTRRLGQDRVAAEPAAAAELIEHCARLPLALGIATARAMTNPGFSLHALAEELRDEHDRLDILATDEPAGDVRAVLSWSYQALSRRAARLFRLLGLHPGPDIALYPAASLAGFGLIETRSLLAELAQTHLLEEHLPGRYRSHDLLRAYAGELVADEDSGTRHAAIHRTLDHYLHAGFAAERYLAPHWEPIVLPAPQRHVAIRRIADYRQAMQWLTAEQANVLAAIELAVRNGFDTHAWQLPWTLSTFLNRQGLWTLRVTTQQTALTAADRLDDPNAQAICHHLLGRGQAILHQYEEAFEHLHTALRRYADLGDLGGQAAIRFSLTQVCMQRERPAEAVDHCSVALELYRASGNPVWEAFSLSALGGCEALLGRYPQSLTHCREALELLHTLGNQDGAAHTLRCLGYVHHQQGEHADAVGCLRDALALFRELGDNYHEADTLHKLGDALQADDRSGQALAAWKRAATILDQLAHPDVDTVRAKINRV